MAMGFVRPSPHCRSRRLVLAAGLLMPATISSCALTPARDGTPAAAGPTRDSAGSADTASPTGLDPAAAFGDLEAEFAARLGVYAIDTGTGEVVEHRADERFGFASTIKLFAAAELLDATTESELETSIDVPETVLAHSPVLEEHAGGTVTLAEAIDASLVSSDNTAADFVFDQLGGPEALEERLRAIGDDTTRVARSEPELNDIAPGDERDTSTARAFATSLRAYTVADTLAEDDRAALVDAMVRSTTGDALIRAGAPTGWTVGDRSGAAGVYGSRNDIGIAYPPDGGAPVVLVIFTDRAAEDADFDDALLAEATQVVFDALRG
ncbi:class A beta-lactamase [Brachybacterium sp. YJGR34]|uniref:class A beta-lactamase n=1 Tax=Brachybacterium sp. YJGR34 TaxID=2059911 RepID=UPI0018E63402|nr:class A beta-lactamase [Brachybacterium sp. YJGR34]